MAHSVSNRNIALHIRCGVVAGREPFVASLADRFRPMASIRRNRSASSKILWADLVLTLGNQASGSDHWTMLETIGLTCCRPRCTRPPTVQTQPCRRRKARSLGCDSCDRARTRDPGANRESRARAPGRPRRSPGVRGHFAAPAFAPCHMRAMSRRQLLPRTGSRRRCPSKTSAQDFGAGIWSSSRDPRSPRP